MNVIYKIKDKKDAIIYLRDLFLTSKKPRNDRAATLMSILRTLQFVLRVYCPSHDELCVGKKILCKLAGCTFNVQTDFPETKVQRNVSYKLNGSN